MRSTPLLNYPQTGILLEADPVPEVDFAKNVIIVAAMGTKSSGGYSITVDEVRIAAGGTRVSVTEVYWYLAAVKMTGCF